MGTKEKGRVSRGVMDSESDSGSSLDLHERLSAQSRSGLSQGDWNQSFEEVTFGKLFKLEGVVSNSILTFS